MILKLDDVRQMNSVRELFAVLGLDGQGLIVCPEERAPIVFDYKISPYLLLSQAASDLHSGGGSALLNSITNSWRAILCQTDRVLGALGLSNHAKSTKTKAELLAFLGLPAPNILRKIGDCRNDLEHRHIPPPLDKVEDAHDIAMLFINAVDRHLDAFLDTFSLGREDEQLGRCFRRELQFRYDHDSHTFEIFAARHSKDECYIGEVLGGIALTNESPIYKHCARLAFIEVSSVPSDQAIDDFFAAVCSAQPAVAGAKNRP